MNKFKNIYLDFDGVIADTNGIKFRAFLKVCRDTDPDNTQLFSEFLHLNMHLSRYQKFAFLHSLSNNISKSINALCSDFEKEYSQGMRDVAKSKWVFKALKDKKIRLVVISSAPKNDIVKFLVANSRLAKRNLRIGKLVILGSPATKLENFRNFQKRITRKGGVYFGDTKADREFALRAKLSFVHIRKWMPSSEKNFMCCKPSPFYPSYLSLDDCFS